MSQPRNGFNLIRLLLALAVVVSHAFSVATGELLAEPLAHSTGFTLGEHAVNGFFAISGFLVAMSFDRRGWRDYLLSRTLRIAPGLVVATLVVGLVFGGAMTSLGFVDYVASPGLWRFVSSTLATFKSNTALPGVFEANPFRFPMGTVWTLKFEVLCYAGVLVLGGLGMLRSKPAAAALVVVLAVSVAGLELLQPGAPKSIETALRLPLIFALGSSLYVWRGEARLSGLLAAALLALAWLAADSFAYKALLFAGSSYAVVWLALSPAVTRWMPDPPADLSYGTYLYGWPVQQCLHATFPTATGLVLVLPSVLGSLAIAALSWFAVEKPALALKARALGQRGNEAVEPGPPDRAPVRAVFADVAQLSAIAQEYCGTEPTSPAAA